MAFLRDRLDETEARAHGIHDMDSGCELVMTTGTSGPCTCGVPAAILAEVTAKRCILKDYEIARKNAEYPIIVATLEAVLIDLVQVYAGREGWCHKWATA